MNIPTPCKELHAETIDPKDVKEIAKPKPCKIRAKNAKIKLVSTNKGNKSVEIPEIKP